MTTPKAQILADSKNTATGDRLTTFVLEFPKVLLAELVTHRVLSRNAASSRAIPMNRIIRKIQEQPFIPYWTRKQRGMSGADVLTQEVKDALTEKWLAARDRAIVAAQEIHELGAAKQEVNRMLEPWMTVPVIASGTDWDNFFHLRCGEEAQPDFAFIAREMRDLLASSTPQPLNQGEWHIPFVDNLADTEVDLLGGDKTEAMLKIATARCARVSYVNHDGEGINVEKDFNLHDRLLEEQHLSPFEHSAMAMGTSDDTLTANFRGFAQYRKWAEGHVSKI